MAQINVAIVGCGFVANSHFNAWRKIPHAKVVAICDTNKKVLKTTAENWKVPRSYTLVSEMSDCKEITLWDICTPPQTHRILANQAMRDGFDVIIEKPLTITSKDAKEIVECQKATRKRACVIHNWLFGPPVLNARARVRRGEIGEIISAHMYILHTKNDPMAANKDHWSHRLPGGRFSEMLAHPIYLMQCFLGEIGVESVNVSKVGEYSWMKYDELFATFTAGERHGGVYVSFNAPRNSIFIDLFGRKGIIRLDIINATVNVLPRVEMNRINKATDSLRQAFQLSASTLRNAVKILSGRWLNGHEMCISLFAKSLIGEEENPVTLEEGYEAVRVLEEMCNIVEKVQAK